MDTLFLETGTALEVKVQPVVLFSILDHFMRRDEGQTRVIGAFACLCGLSACARGLHQVGPRVRLLVPGTLLGSVHNGVVEVRNCFPVPHVEKGGEVRLH